MTILFFARLFYPHVGGVEKHVFEISRRLVKEGHTVVVVTENHSWRKFESVEGIKVYRVAVGQNEFLKKFNMWWWLAGHIHLIREAAIIHCHDVFIWYFPFSLLFPMKNAYTTFHGYEGNKIPGIKAKLMHKIAEFMSNKNICVGEFLEKWYGTKATYITYGATDRIKIKDVRFKNRDQKVRIAYVGRLEEEAGILDYIKALKLLKEKNVKTSLTVLGDGSQKKLSERMAKENHLAVTFLGFVKNPEKYIQQANIVFVSRYLGILEALSAKKYVIAVYNNAIKKDYLTMTPFAKYIWVAKNARDIAKNVLFIVKEKSLKQRIETGSAWANKQTWENMVNTYKKLWQI